MKKITQQTNQNAPLRFLLTNDDGIAAPGLWAAARVLSGYGSVLVVAPATNYSGFGTALPASRALTYAPYHLGPALPNVRAIALSATPATCAFVGVQGAFDESSFDLVVSGVNSGSNMGHDVFYSGTVGAALTAQLLGVSAIAMSLDMHTGDDEHWESSAWALRETIEMWRAQRESTPIVFNVNVPNRRAETLGGIQLTSLSDHSFMHKYRFEHDADAGNTLKVIPTADQRGTVPQPYTDAWAVAQGYVSITPLRPVPELLSVAPLTLQRVSNNVTASRSNGFRR
jgi:5'-nucleotidase